MSTDENVNADFARRVVLHGEKIAWQPSPMPGVERRRLDRVVPGADDGGRAAVGGTAGRAAGGERVTTLVRYAPNSRFSSHVHTGGEEFVVLEGVFEDDYGDWPAGSYIRNPPGSRHTPGSASGCTILVKLWQFDPDDRTFVHANLDKLGEVPEAGRPGVKASPLYRDAREEVRVERWAPGARVTFDAAGGAELFVLDGGFREGGDALGRHSWLRTPHGTRVEAVAGGKGARVWIKRGHLWSAPG